MEPLLRDVMVKTDMEISVLDVSHPLLTLFTNVKKGAVI